MPHKPKSKTFPGATRRANHRHRLAEPALLKSRSYDIYYQSPQSASASAVLLLLRISVRVRAWIRAPGPRAQGPWGGPLHDGRLCSTAPARPAPSAAATGGLAVSAAVSSQPPTAAHAAAPTATHPWVPQRAIPSQRLPAVPSWCITYSTDCSSSSTDWLMDGRPCSVLMPRASNSPLSMAGYTHSVTVGVT